MELSRRANMDTVMRLRRDYGAKVLQSCGRLRASRTSWEGWEVWGALWSLFLHVGIAGVAAGVGFAAAQNAAHKGSLGEWSSCARFFSCYVFAVMVVGSRMRALGNMLHEASHRSLSRSVRVNDALGHLLAAIDFQSFQNYRREHLSHHLYLGTVERDLDFQRTRAFGFATRVASPWKTHIGGALKLRHLPAFLRPVLWSREDGPRVTLLRLLGYVAVVLGLTLASGWQVFFLVFVIPYITSYQVFRYWSDAFDHGSLLAEEDEFLRSRNHAFLFFEDKGVFARKFGLFLSYVANALIFPRNDAYHLTHHLFPSVPTRLLPEAHRILLQDSLYAARNHIVSAKMFEGLYSMSDSHQSTNKEPSWHPPA